MTSSEAYLEYKEFISNVAKLVKRDTRICSLDVQDLEQDGAVFLLSLWRRKGIPEKERIMLFTASLEGHLRNIVKARYVRDNKCFYVSPMFDQERTKPSVLDRHSIEYDIDSVGIPDIVIKIWDSLDATGRVLLTELLALNDRHDPMTCYPVYWWTEIRKRLGLTVKQMRTQREFLMKRISEIVDEK